MITIGKRIEHNINPGQIAAYSFDYFNGLQLYCKITLKSGKEFVGEIDPTYRDNVENQIKRAWGTG